VSSSRSSRIVRGGLAALTAGAIAATAAPAGAFAADSGTPIYYPTFNGSSTELNRNGTADIIKAGPTRQRILRLTAGGFRQTGSAWSTTKIDTNQSFETMFKVWMHHGLPRGDYADGMAFVVQDDGTRALGGWGGGLGVRGIRHSVAVAFDTYSNPPALGRNQVGLVVGGNPDYPVASAASPLPLEDRPFLARVVYDASAKELTVSMKSLRAGSVEHLVLSQTVDLAGAVGSSSAFVGFTGSTGSVISKEDIYSWVLSTPGA
jgi:hypothetical protein